MCFQARIRNSFTLRLTQLIGALSATMSRDQNRKPELLNSNKHQALTLLSSGADAVSLPWNLHTVLASIGTTLKVFSVLATEK